MEMRIHDMREAHAVLAIAENAQLASARCLQNVGQEERIPWPVDLTALDTPGLTSHSNSHVSYIIIFIYLYGTFSLVEVAPYVPGYKYIF